MPNIPLFLVKWIFPLLVLTTMIVLMVYLGKNPEKIIIASKGSCSTDYTQQLVAAWMSTSIIAVITFMYFGFMIFKNRGQIRTTASNMRMGMANGMSNMRMGMANGMSNMRMGVNNMGNNMYNGMANMGNNMYNGMANMRSRMAPGMMPTYDPQAFMG